MEYHNPDSRWQIFGLNNFEDYCNKVVIKAKLHSCVPKGVSEAFEMAEYMMAHAYYHYPLYHEAFSKVLRIIEMAVKHRCMQLNIPLEPKNKKNSRIEKKALKRLMDDLIKAEPSKQLKNQFEVARRLRNSTMHPSQHIYSGAMTKIYIMHAITLLNTLFLPEATFVVQQHKLTEIQEVLTSFKERVLTIEVSSKKFLVTGISIEAAVCMENVWHNLLIGYPVMLNPLENLTNHSYLKLLDFSVNNLHISNKKIEAVNDDENGKIIILPTNHPSNIKMHKSFQTALETVEENDRIMYKHHLSHEVGEMETAFWYDKLWKIKI